eukprot:TRINITY_DN24462_c0_g1_i1.p1 TRINITY_DN24462_c0_g1~~TRINITY_DN24462_c0_g1_i1.p1  ORF type:complete len:626 (+),score=150.89 TRINITY_DN24462_c0_g1_i1:78-1955(+)
MATLAGLANGGMVPRLDICGYQDKRHPFRDLSNVAKEDIRHARWKNSAPKVRSRAELEQARKAARVPDPRSYDLDGDGVVGQSDYHIARMFDKDIDGKLTADERKKAEKALERGLLDKYTRLDAKHCSQKPYQVQQRRGQIWSYDNTAEASNACPYPPHPGSHKVPSHDTRTSLILDRVAELKNSAMKFGEKMAADNAPVREPQPHNAQSQPRSCDIAHMWERAEADHQAARVRGGLTASVQPVNPEREYLLTGMDYVHEPLIASRSGLHETRKELMKRDAEDLRKKGDDLFPPNSVRKCENEAVAFDFRRPPPGAGEPMTLTRLKDDRRVEKIEHNLSNFGNPRAPAQYPRYSDTEVPFWQYDEAGNPREPPKGCTLQTRQMSEPNLKVTETPWESRKCEPYPEGGVLKPPAGLCSLTRPLKAAESEPSLRLGSNTVQRWSTDCLEHGHLQRNKPRLFDSLRPPHIGPRDLEELDVTSSMEPIRREALRRQAEERKQNAMKSPKSKLAPFGVGASTDSLETLALLEGGHGQHRQRHEHDVRVISKGARNRVHSVPAGISFEMPAKEPGLLSTVLKRPKSEQTGIRSGGFQRIDLDLHTTAGATVQASQQSRSRRHSTSAAVALG